MRSGNVTNVFLQSAAVFRWGINDWQTRFLMVGFAIYDLQPLLDLRFAKLFSTLAWTVVGTILQFASYAAHPQPSLAETCWMGDTTNGNLPVAHRFERCICSSMKFAISIHMVLEHINTYHAIIRCEIHREFSSRNSVSWITCSRLHIWRGWKRFVSIDELCVQEVWPISFCKVPLSYGGA